MQGRSTGNKFPQVLFFWGVFLSPFWMIISQIQNSSSVVVFSQHLKYFTPLLSSLHGFWEVRCNSYLCSSKGKVLFSPLTFFKIIFFFFRYSIFYFKYTYIFIYYGYINIYDYVVNIIVHMKAFTFKTVLGQWTVVYLHVQYEALVKPMLMEYGSYWD